jgi:hypothetical protein
MTSPHSCSRSERPRARCMRARHLLTRVRRSPARHTGSMSGTSTISPTRFEPSGSRKVRAVIPIGPKSSSRFGEASQWSTSSTSWNTSNVGIVLRLSHSKPLCPVVCLPSNRNRRSCPESTPRGRGRGQLDESGRQLSAPSGRLPDRAQSLTRPRRRPLTRRPVSACKGFAPSPAPRRLLVTFRPLAGAPATHPQSTSARPDTGSPAETRSTTISESTPKRRNGRLVSPTGSHGDAADVEPPGGRAGESVASDGRTELQRATSIGASAVGPLPRFASVARGALGMLDGIGWCCGSGATCRRARGARLKTMACTGPGAMA